MTQSTDSASGKTPARAWYALALFVGVQMLTNIDKAILGVLAEPIKSELGLSDGSIALLSGAGFAIVFAIAGFPLGRWADRGNRRNILAVCLAIFSAMTAAAAFATNFLTLLLTRFGVAVGEAGSGPAIASMLSDNFPQRRHATVMSIYYMGVPLGLFCMFLFGTAIAHSLGWRAAFLVVGLPGVALALLIRLTVKEPHRVQATSTADAPPPFGVAIRLILAQRSVRHLLSAATLIAIVNAGVLLWAVSMLVRTHGFTLAEAGRTMAIALGVFGTLGTASAGWIIDWIARDRAGWRPWLCAGILAIAMPAALVFLLGPTKEIALIGAFAWAFVGTAVFGPIMGMYQGLVVSRLRGTVTAMHLFVSGLIGISIGAQLVGFLSDFRLASAGANSLRDAMVVLVCLYPWAILHLILSSRTMARDLAHPAG